MKLRIYSSKKTIFEYFGIKEKDYIANGIEATVYYDGEFIYKKVKINSAYSHFMLTLNDKRMLNTSKYLPKIYKIMLLEKNIMYLKWNILNIMMMKNLIKIKK